MQLYEPLFRALNASGARDDIEKLEAIARLKGKRDEPREDT